MTRAGTRRPSTRPVVAPDPGAWLVEAERLLARPDTEEIWVRGSVWLSRIALEDAVRAAWLAHHPDSDVRRMRTLLLGLELVTDPDTRRRACALWHALSRAGHHHHYELAPTAAEAAGWVSDVRDVVERLRVRPCGQTAAPD